MAEPKGKEAELIRDTFIEAYNRLHGTTYTPSSTKPSEPTDLLFDGSPGSEPLKVQLTRAVGDRESEFRHPAEVTRWVIDRLQSHLRAINSRGFVVSISVDRLPRTTDEKHRLFARLWAMIFRYLGPLGPPRSTVRRLHVDRYVLQDYQEIADFVSDLDVCQVEGDQPTSIISSSTAGAFIVDVARQAAISLKDKAERYRSSASDHVLLIACETLPYSGYDLRALEEAIGAQPPPPFREIWLVSLWGEPRADRAWPPLTVSDLAE